MNKYTIFRMPAEDDENYDQHELVGVEYGEDIYDVTDKLTQAIYKDLFENPDYALCDVALYAPNDLDGGADAPYQYQMRGFVLPTNTAIFYGISEVRE